MDTSIAPDSGMNGDSENENVELPVDVDSLSIDGTNPQVGDQVDIKVGGSVTRVVNNVAYVKPETINGTPMPSAPLDTDDNVSETDRLQQLSQQADSQASY